MKLTVNGRVAELGPGSTVAAVVETMGRGPAGTAVAVNEEVVPRSLWATTALRDDDRVEVLIAAQGG